MMFKQALTRGRMTITSAVLMALAGMMAWQTMPRQEDPTMPDYWGNVVAVFPGADAETVERLILEPIEEHLAEVDALGIVVATARNEQVLIYIEMDFGTTALKEAWEDVEDALDDAYAEFPEGAWKPTLDYDLNDQESIVVSLEGSADPLALDAAAETLKKELLGLKEVAKVKLVGEPDEQILIAFDDEAAKRLGIDVATAASQLQGRNQNIPGGTIKLVGRSVNLRPGADFQSIQDIRETPIVLPSGAAIPLTEIADVRYGPREPATSVMRHNGARAVGIGIVPKDEVHLIQFGEAVRKRIAETAPALAPVQVKELVYQPDRVNTRLNDLGKSLLTGILIVAAILLLFMGPRLGFVVASVLPLVALTALAVFAISGGRLQQMSISALVIALGMLVDNAIVMAENIQWRVDRGTKPFQAALQAVRELALPLGSATATTLAAFIPMFLSKGPTADFTRDLPIVISLTLVISYLYAVFITPKLSQWLLRPRKKATSGKLGQRLGQVAIRYRWLVLVGAALMVMLSIFAAGGLSMRFFPSADRNQLVVELQLPEGSHIDTTNQAALQLERALMKQPGVQSVAAFVGRSAPHFYYNLSQIPWSPHFAQIVVKTETLDQIEALVAFTRAFGNREMPAYQLIPRKLEQGPPVDNPVEVRLYSEDLGKLHQAANQVLAVLREIPGTVNVRHDLSLGAPSLKFQIDDAAAARLSLNRAQVASTLFGRTRGMSVGQYRGGEDPIPVLLRSSAGEGLAAEQLETMDVAAPGQKPVPLAQVAHMHVEIRPAAITHRNQRRVAVVSSLLEDEGAFSQIMTTLTAQMETLELPPGIEFEYGGLGEGSQEANSALATTLPFGVMVLFGILLLQFNSFRKVGIIFMTVPFAATGVIPGLLLANKPFGFMSLLGVISLVGIVVNNAIVLMDVIETQRKAGETIEKAVLAAVERRTRPILLTTATTVMGLLPLAFSGSNLWPPMAWAIISGLLASTVLTLLVVPALYLILFREKKTDSMAKPALALLFLMAWPTVLAQEPPAVTMTLDQVLEAATQRDAARGARDLANAAQAAAEVEKRAAYFPTVGIQGNQTWRDETASIDTPAGMFQLGESSSRTLDAQVVQPLFRPAEMRYGVPAALQEATAAKARSQRTLRELRAAAMEAYFVILQLNARLAATDRFIDALNGRLEQLQASANLGRALETDLLKVQLDRDAALQERKQLAAQAWVSRYRLGRAVGIDGAVEPNYTAPLLETVADMDQLTARAVANREDLGALKIDLKAAELRRKAIQTEWLPQLEAAVTYSHADGDPFRDGDFFQGALQFSWVPFAGGTRKARKAVARYQEQGLDAQIAEHQRGVVIEIREALANLDVAEGAVNVAETGVKLATETLRVERARFESGRVTTNDLLDAEASLRQQSAALAIARLDVHRAHLRLKFTLGEL